MDRYSDDAHRWATKLRDLVGHDDADALRRGIAEAKRSRDLAGVWCSAVAQGVAGLDKTMNTKESLMPLQGSKYTDAGTFFQKVALFAKYGDRHAGLMRFDDKGTGYKALSEGVGASGGFLVPDEFRHEILGAIYNESDFARRCRRLPMRHRTLRVPTVDQTGTGADGDHWHGGVQVYWTEEAAAKTESSPDFRQVLLEANKLIAYTRSSDEVLADAPTLEAWLRGPEGLAAAIRWELERTIIRGTGVGQPLGIISAGATITVARESVADVVTYADLLGMREALLPSSRKAVWLIHPALLSNFGQINGPSGNASYVFPAGDVLRVPTTIGNVPVLWTEHCSAPGSAGDVILADFSYYLIGDRQAVTVESTNAERFQYDQTSFRAVMRVDGRPLLSTYVTLRDGSTTVSPFVILGDKST